MRKYTATATREGKWWMIRIPELDGLTQARRLSEAAHMAHDYIAVTLDDAPAETIEVDVVVDKVAGVHVAARLTDLRSARERADKASRDAAELAARLAKDLSLAGVPVRDVGFIMGLSHQRAHQLEQEGTQSAWSRLAPSARDWLCEHQREPVPAEVWNQMQVARFVDWWSTERTDGARTLDSHAWQYIAERAAETQNA